MGADLMITSGVVVGAAWAAKKVLGPTLDAMGGDLASYYRFGVDRILASAYRKTKDIDDGKVANLRVAHDILQNGAFSTDEFVLEYFGGLLASSRSSDGWKDDVTPFVDVVKSLSSSQLRLHYNIYNALEQLALRDSEIRKSSSSGSDAVKSKTLYMHYNDVDTVIHLNVLARHGLIESGSFTGTSFHYPDDNEEQILFYMSGTPTIFGVMLYAAVHGMLDAWQIYGRRKMEGVEDIEAPAVFGLSMEELVSKAIENGITTPHAP